MYNAWLDRQDFKILVGDEWKKLSKFHVSQKLKLIKAPNKVWNREKFGSIELKIKRVEEEVNKIEKRGDELELSPMGLSRLKALNVEGFKCKGRRLQLMRHYSILKILTEKDNNAKFFHAIATSNRKRNVIRKMKINNS